MRRFALPPLLILFLAGATGAAEPAPEALPTDEPGAIAYLTARGVSITKDSDGRAVKLFSRGKPPLSVEEYQLIGRLVELQELAINGAPLAEGQWGFLRSLPKLRRLAVWHCPKFATLEPFCGLPVESLTIGGCMGLRDLNKQDPEQLRHAIKTLRNLPNLKRANLYHSPLAPDDSHLAHLAAQFPALEDLRLDFTAPRGSATTITPAGLARLRNLPLAVLSIENAESFSAEHFAAIAGIRSLKTLLVDARRSGLPAEGLAAFRGLRPDVVVAVAQAGDAGPPRVQPPDASE